MMRRWSRNAEGPPPKISVVVAVYNKPQELELVLEAYLNQDILKKDSRAFELILADDGSESGIEALCRRFSQEASFPFIYLWQKDKGWGKPRMLNWSVLEARAERIVFTDGDCVPHGHFVSAHLEEAEDRTVLCGRRVDLMEKISSQISIGNIRSRRLTSRSWLAERILKDEVDFGQQGIFLPRPLAEIVRKFYRKPTLLGSNFSIEKKWLLELNGFDEKFTVPGIGEDTDMQRRFELAGLKIKWITFRAIQYHIWHKLTAVGEQAHKIFEDLKARNTAQAVQGIKEFPQSSLPA